MATKSEIDALTGIRFFAAFYVLVYHLRDNYLQPFFPDFAKPIEILFGNGWLGVDLFFVLSGFVLAYNYFDKFEQDENKKYGTFLLKRLARIYPLHFVTLLTLLGFALYTLSADPNSPLIHNEKYDTTELIKSFLIVHAWNIPMPVSWNRVSWSISAEWLAYLLLPVFVMLLAHIQTRKGLIRCIVTIYISLFLITTILFQLSIIGPYGWSLQIGSLRILAAFPVGMIVFLLVSRHTSPETNGQKSTANPWLIIATLCSLIIPVANMWALPLFAWLLYLIACNRFPFNTLLSRPAFVYGGKISYALYLVHGVLIEIFILVLPPEAFVDSSIVVRISYIVGFVAASLALSIFAYHCIEEPCRKYIVRRFNALPQTKQA